MIDPAAITLIQTTCLHHLTHAFSILTSYSQRLLYFFTAFEIFCLGILISLDSFISYGTIFLRFLKLSLICFLIQHFGVCIEMTFSSFIHFGSQLMPSGHAVESLLNPALLWQFGYNDGIALLKAATQTTSIGMAMIEVIMGFSMVFLLGLFGLQSILSLVGFYMVACISLILLPMSVFEPIHTFFDKSVQSVLQAGTRVMVMIFLVALFITCFSQLYSNEELNTIHSISESLGIILILGLFVLMGKKLSEWASNTIGELTTRFTTPLSSIQQIATEHDSNQNYVHTNIHDFETMPIETSTFRYPPCEIKMADSIVNESIHFTHLNSLSTLQKPILNPLLNDFEHKIQKEKNPLKKTIRNSLPKHILQKLIESETKKTSRESL